MDPSPEETARQDPPVVTPEDASEVASRGAAGETQRERHAHGMAVRREVLGDAHVDRAVAATTPFTSDFQDLITRYAWGEIWARPGLDRHTRSCVTLAILTSLGCEEELAMHVRAALRVGVSREEIAEVLLQAGLYAGVPRSNRAFAVADRALRDVHETGADDTGSATGTEGRDGGTRRER